MKNTTKELVLACIAAQRVKNCLLDALDKREKCSFVALPSNRVHVYEGIEYLGKLFKQPIQENERERFISVNDFVLFQLK